ncbi:MAG: DUF5615 family PIN-like protein [Rhodocyclaceae bacterium]|nr:DUF5615 family PIN-like protein [Rhodocyclaceae bacterium]
MKFLVDAQLPRRMCEWLREAGLNAEHTLDLPLGNRTPDAEILDRADSGKLIIVTKDADFVQSFLIAGRPPRLLLISTGNVGNGELKRLMRAHLDKIVEAFMEHRFVELGLDALVIHE